ncbi:MAG: hypothetical protein KDI06_23640, partial [Calditrichaeota bacterium]|nr:hypothetical protein [Calditrichota bacterium]
KTVNHRLWARLRGALSERDTLEIVPAFTDQTDKYTAISAILRENRYRYGEVHLDYFHALGQNRLGMRGDARITRQTARRAWNDKTESDGSLRLYTARNKGRISWEGEAGAYLNSSASIAPGARVLAGMSLSSATRLEFLGEHRPRAVPLLWRTVSGDSITPFTGDVWMTHRQGSVSLIQDLWGERLEMRLGAFWNRAAGYPVWQPGSRSWLRNTIENRGLQLKTRLAVSHFRLSNDFSYNADYQEAFAPEINNITEVGVRVPLFKGALFLEGLASWHYLGYYRVVAFNRFLMQYSPGLEPDRGPYYLADARVQLSVNQVIISFVFENLLSEDVEIVKGTDDTLRIFRFGVDWILFD